MIEMTTTAGRTRRTPSRTRRLATVATAGLAVAVLSACGSDDQPAQVGALAPIEVPASASAAPGSAAPSAPAPAGQTPSGAPSATALGETVVDDGAELEVEDQSGDGSGVRVESVRLTSGSGHVAVQTRDGQVLGSAPVTRGSQPVTIALSPPVTGSGELLAVLYADDGDGTFDPTADAVVVDDEGDRESEDFDYRVR